jgi:hypothetical protein
MIEVRFRSRGEIRMGSPFSVYDLKLSGDWVPELPTHDWQNVYARSPDERYLILTRWDTTGNVPGFYFVLIDSVRKTTVQTGVYPGCCTKLTWADDGALWEAWTVDGETSGKLRPPPKTLRASRAAKGAKGESTRERKPRAQPRRTKER